MAPTDDRERRDSISRHTIEQQACSIYFRLVEDSQGAWVSYANHNALVSKLEDRIEAAEAALAQLRTRVEALPASAPWPVSDVVKRSDVLALLASRPTGEPT